MISERFVKPIKYVFTLTMWPKVGSENMLIIKVV